MRGGRHLNVARYAAAPEALLYSDLAQTAPELVVLYLRIKLFDWGKGDGCTASIQRLAGEGRDDKQTRRNLQRLESLGWVRVERPVGQKPLIFCLDKPATLPSEGGPRAREPSPRRGSPSKGVPVKGDPRPRASTLPVEDPDPPLPRGATLPFEGGSILIDDGIDQEQTTGNRFPGGSAPPVPGGLVLTSPEGPQDKPKKAPRKPARPPEEPAATTPIWDAYAAAHEARWKARPLRSAKANTLLKQFLAQVPAEEAPDIAAFYVDHPGAFYVTRMHPLDLLAKDAPKLRTEWVTGRRVNAESARRQEQTEANPFYRIAREMQSQEEQHADVIDAEEG